MTAFEQNAGSHERRRSRARRMVYAAAIVAALTLLVFANAHLVHVAITSQPDCVVHIKSGQSSPGQFSAAGSAC